MRGHSTGSRHHLPWMNTALALALPLLLAGAALAQPASVRVESGLLAGAAEDGLMVYRGIPFAAPPTGPLRWRPPAPPLKWTSIRLADKFGPACIQQNPALARLAPPSEDCLYLNVWTPAKRAGEKLPVMFWIHGGGFTAGATAEAFYHGEQLAKKGVVVVSTGYRLGALGFLAHPGLSAESPKHVSGNYGLLDIIAALGWVQRNVSAFGGDPKRVTIFGESAGGIAVSMLCASPLAKGLFHGAISQSGASFGPVRSGDGVPGENMASLAGAETAGQAWAAAAGASSVAEMRALPADKILALSRSSRGVGWPVADGWVIPGDQYQLYEARRYNDTPILVGYNSDEGALFSAARTPEAHVRSVRQRFGPFADKLLSAYPAGDGAVAKTARDLTRDAAFGWHAWTWARLQTKTGKSKAFVFYFDQHPEYPASSPRAGFGAMHGAELPYVFQHLGGAGPNRPPATAEDQAISEAMATYWTNFAKRGDPNGEGLPQWPAFREPNPHVMYFRGVPKAGPVVSEDGLKALEEYFQWRRSGADAPGSGVKR